MESWFKEWVVEPHTFDDSVSLVAIPLEALFIAFAVGDFSRRKFNSARNSLFAAALFYLFARFS